MAAAKCGLRRYSSDGRTVFAARIKEIKAFGTMPGAKTLLFSDSPKRANVVPDWFVANRPAVGGYFVIEDVDGKTLCHFMKEEQFSSFKPS